MLKAFKDVEANFDERELGLFCLKLGLKLDQEGEDPEKASSLKRFNDSLGYLNRANRMLIKLEEEDSCSVDDIRPILHVVQLELANSKTAMGRREDAHGNLRNCLEIKELTFEKKSREIGNANRDLAEAYVAVLNFKEALPFCLKALEIHKAQLGNSSVEVAHDRRMLGLSIREIDAAKIQIALGKYDEAIDTLKGKFPDSKRCLDIACGILDKKEDAFSIEVAEAYMEISMQYETMNEFETAITLVKRSQSVLEKLPQEQHSEGSVSARIGWLLLLTGKVQQAIPYLESAAERLKECFGSKHYGVGYIYNNLGAAYLELDRPQSAAQMFAVAKDIMDVSLGPGHVDTIEACQNLSKAYGAMWSNKRAIITSSVYHHPFPSNSVSLSRSIHGREWQFFFQTGLRAVPSNYVFPQEKRPGNLNAVPVCKTIPVIDLGQLGGPNRADVINHGVLDELMDDTVSLFEEFFDSLTCLLKKRPSTILRTEPRVSGSTRAGGGGICGGSEEAKHEGFGSDCEGLGIELGYFGNEISKTQVLTVNHYPPCPTQVWCWEYLDTDPNLLTLLQQEIVSNGKLKSAHHRTVTNTSVGRP
ncbi:tetratricopeptide repeat (TPR)-like superfamily protein [Actinidia rufa]|uniref:Tetratricopeptide repeat (TPR)-like superfamily protein n=1 Tax=Actinidia rufa TaxID=165716 RepID=A0A7J0GSE1_9ERIC|nr:tetratricopeptide repeat (TPR)-like superfamily protein [Actinidia rufa]